MVGALPNMRPQPWSLLVGASMRQIVIAIIISCIGLATDPKFAEGAQNIAVPSYVFPCFTSGCAWDVFKRGASIVIINPNSGPEVPDSGTLTAYVLLVDTLKQNSTVTTVLGYVSTDYGRRNSSRVLSDIALYYQNFSTKIDGIFLDEGNSSCAATALATYKSYDDRVKALWGSSGFTALNWGAPGSECYLTSTTINSFCTFEGSFSTYDSPAYASSPAWVFNYPATAFWHIVYGTPNNVGSVTVGVNLSTSRHAGNIYFTDALYQNPSQNPYNVTPSPTVWQTEVDLARQNSANVYCSSKTPLLRPFCHTFHHPLTR